MNIQISTNGIYLTLFGTRIIDAQFGEFRNPFFGFVFEKGYRGRLFIELQLGSKIWRKGRHALWEPEVIRSEMRDIHLNDTRVAETPYGTLTYCKAIKHNVNEDGSEDDMPVWFIIGNPTILEKLGAFNYVPQYSRDGRFQYPMTSVATLISLSVMSVKPRT